MRVNLLFFLLLTGCMVGPNYHRPVLEIPTDYRFDKQAKETLNHAWWEQFEDPVLVSLIEEAVKNNYDIKIAAANIDQALGVLMQTRSELFPQIGYDATGARVRQSQTIGNALPPAFFNNPFSNYEAAAQGSWQIDLFGRIRRLTEAARADLYASCQARRAVILSIVALTANTYLELIGFDAQLKVAEETLKAYEEEVTYFTHQFNYGQASKMAVVQAQTQYEIAASTIPQVELLIAQTENALSILLGSNPKEIPRGKTLYELTLPSIPQGVPSEILSNRPDVAQAEFELVSSNAIIGAAKALYFPDISLTGLFGYASSDLSTLFVGPSRTWSYAGSVIGPIFTFGNIYGQVKQAEAANLAALYNYQNSIITAFSDVENALASHQYLQEQFDAQKKLVAASGEYVRLAQLQYHGGYSPYFVVLQAQEQYFPAQLSWIDTRVGLFSSVVNTYQAMGGGWITIVEDLPSINLVR